MSSSSPSMLRKASKASMSASSLSSSFISLFLFSTAIYSFHRSLRRLPRTAHSPSHSVAIVTDSDTEIAKESPKSLIIHCHTSSISSIPVDTFSPYSSSSTFPLPSPTSPFPSTPPSFHLSLPSPPSASSNSFTSSSSLSPSPLFSPSPLPSRQHLPIIAIDIDEVLGYFVFPLISFTRRQYHFPYEISDYFSYHFCLPWGVSEAKATEIISEFFRSPEFDDPPVVQGAKDILLSLYDKFRFVIVTSRENALETRTRQWIYKHYGNVLFDDIKFGNHYGTSGVRREKSAICAEIGAICLVDDNVKYCREVVSKIPHSILLDNEGMYRWSQERDGSPPKDLPQSVYRVMNWKEVGRKLEEIGRGL